MWTMPPVLTPGVVSASNTPENITLWVQNRRILLSAVHWLLSEDTDVVLKSIGVEGVNAWLIAATLRIENENLISSNERSVFIQLIPCMRLSVLKFKHVVNDAVWAAWWKEEAKDTADLTKTYFKEVLLFQPPSLNLEDVLTSIFNDKSTPRDKESLVDLLHKSTIGSYVERLPKTPKVLDLGWVSVILGKHASIPDHKVLTEYLFLTVLPDLLCSAETDYAKVQIILDFCSGTNFSGKNLDTLGIVGLVKACCESTNPVRTMLLITTALSYCKDEDREERSSIYLSWRYASEGIVRQYLGLNTMEVVFLESAVSQIVGSLDSTPIAEIVNSYLQVYGLYESLKT